MNSSWYALSFDFTASLAETMLTLVMLAYVARLTNKGRDTWLFIVYLGVLLVYYVVTTFNNLTAKSDLQATIDIGRRGYLLVIFLVHLWNVYQIGSNPFRRELPWAFSGFLMLFLLSLFIIPNGQLYSSWVAYPIGYVWVIGLLERKIRFVKQTEQDTWQRIRKLRLYKGFSLWAVLMLIVWINGNLGLWGREIGILLPVYVHNYVHHTLILSATTYATIIYLNYAEERTAFRAKVVGVVLCVLLILLGLMPIAFEPLLRQLPNADDYLQPVLLGVTILIPLTTLLAVWLLPLFFRVNLLRPLVQLQQGVQRVNQGDLSTVVPVEVNDEVGELTQQFNQMTQSLRQSRAKLVQYAETLEDKVAERTAELEAKNRELVIEAALERVRSRTMAMYKSTELAEVATLLYQQIQQLGGIPDRFSIGVFDEPNGVAEVWPTDQIGRQFQNAVYARLDERTTVSKMYDCWKSGQKSQVIDLQGEDLNEWIRYAREELGVPVNEHHFNGRRVHNLAYFSQGWLDIMSLEPISPELLSILERFAAVFGLTYTRFLDLQKAEAQARESQIEASLERVRAKAMAMRSSDDLNATISIFYSELSGLGLTPKRYGVGLIVNKAQRIAEILSISTTDRGEAFEVLELTCKDHPLLVEVFDHWLDQKEEYYPVLRGNEIKQYYEHIRPHVNMPDFPDDAVQYGYFVFFDDGGVFTWTHEPMQEEEKKLYRRFSAILNLTYRRYKELQLSEANERKAIRQASLDRVRAEIASMRTTNDLQRITPLVWQELTILKVPFIRCGVFIMDDEAEKVHTYLSTPDGQAIAAFDLPYHTPGITADVVAHWHQRQIFIDHWDETQFLAWGQSLASQGLIQSGDSYMSATPPKQLSLHFVPFLQGMLYVGNVAPLNPQEIGLVQALAEAFSTAYARYQDFTRLEEAKQQVETAFAELKTTQAQLIQKEKMASLGELTAGIAHEIQNPLNFVNNFAEVSVEMADELQESLQKGEVTNAADLSTELRENMGYIVENGKRAAGIVRSMLEHSRSSTGERRPTNLNELADEYLKLAYHGMRAQDPEFQVQLCTQFDDNLKPVTVAPQEIGRVLLNLYNNAFYAVRQKQQQQANGFEPQVTVSTHVEQGRVELRVKDNGMGIPDSIRGKVFQPFFTTKPTGQGTGLGLSLSYDIITKGHGGEMQVESREGEGTVFQVRLPVPYG
ncbi:hypothetical protein GCM10023187_10610 [Nibrella viscosa]|uniref:histidine kinase n=1 Tax=Nibrella viscosa TaxID=1084524 RepID=A0ABP8K174_9BACT